MDFKIASLCLSIILFTCVTEANNINSDGESRQPRGSGRIVKLYSGVRPDPIVCTNEGFQGDPNNCAVFYRCIKSGRGKYTAYKFQCAPGTVYDPDTEVCNHPRNTRRSECGGLKPSANSPQHGVNEINEVHELPLPITTKAPLNTPLSTQKPNEQFTQKPTLIYWQGSSSSASTGHHEVSPYPWGSTTQRHSSVMPPVTPVSQQNAHEDICTSDGFMGDSINCQKFYRCVGNQHNGFTKYAFSCSEPTIWDDDIKSCNHPWAVKRGRCGRSDTLGDRNGASEPTIVSQQTASNIVPVAITSNVFSHPTTTVKPVTPSSNDKSIQNQLQISYGSTVHQTQTQISNNSVIQNQTQINYGDRINKTDKVQNTQSQNQISHGSAISQSQTQISYGNEVVQTQVQIDHSKQSSQTQVQITESTTPATKSTHAHKQNVTHNNQNVNNICSQSGFMGDAKNCQKFYRCVDNGMGGFIRHEFSCGQGTVWDQSIEACNHAWAVKGCGGMLSSSDTTMKLPHTTSTHSTTTRPSDNNYPTTEVSHSDDIDDVGYNNNHATSPSISFTKPTTAIIYHNDTECKSSGFVGDAKNCQIFYSCVENGRGGYTKYEFKCGEGTLWDPDIGTCNHAPAVKSCGVMTPPSSVTESISLETVTTSTFKITTSVYTTSSTTHVTTQNDDNDIGYGNNNEQPSSSLPPDNVGNECQSNGFMGDKNDCKKFYRCVDNGNGNYIRYEFTCGEGTAWDSKIEGCNHAWAVDCNNIAIVPTTTKATTHIPTQKIPITVKDEDDSGYNIPENDNNSDVSTEKTTLSTSLITTTESANVNKCKESGFMGDIKDCKKFYRCVDNGDGSFIRHEFSCGEGTVWDQKIEACNHAWAVEKCGGYYEAGHGETTTNTHNVTVSDEEHGYPTPAYPSATPIHEDEVTDKSTQSTTATSTTASASNCNSDGFIGDALNCKRFYRCVSDGRGSFIKYEFQCGDGTVWDPSLESCNHDWAVKACGSSNGTIHKTNETTTEALLILPSEEEDRPTEKTSSTTDSTHVNDITENCNKEGFMGDASDCKKFYRCVSKEQGGFTKYEFTCGKGTYWNQNIQACDHASSKNPCKENGNDMVTKEPHSDNDETYVETTTKIILTTESQEHAVSSTKKPQNIGTICHSEGFYGDQNDCQKFYRCVNDGKGSYTKYEFNCGEGTAWDQELTTCTHKSKSNGCSLYSETSSQANVSSHENDISISSTVHIPHQTSTENVNGPHHTSTENHSSGSYECTSEGFYANPEDCTKFIRCVSNGEGTFTTYHFACGEGTVWVQELLACDHNDGTASCHAQSEGTTHSQTNSEISTQSNVVSISSTLHTGSIDKNDSEGQTGITKAPGVVSGDCQSEGFYGDKNDCKKYYRCVPNDNHGYTKYVFICGEGTAWDAKLNTCNYNSVFNCHETHQPDNQTESVVHDEISETTESSTTTSSSTSITQASTTESKESSSAEIEVVCEKEGFFGNSKDCQKFYRCVDNGKGGYTKYDFTCGEGTLWDQDLLTCNHPHDVVNPSCNQDNGENASSTSETSSISTSTTTQSSQSTTQSSVTETESSATTTQSSLTTTQSSGTTASSTASSSNCTHEETSKKPGNTNVICTEAGYYPDPNDCKKFYRCVDWDGQGEKFSVYFFECGEGTIWDPALDTCNHEESVYPPRDCSNSQLQTTSSGQEPTTTEQLTTQGSTTTEKATTEYTSETTTIQPTTTSEKTTTEQLTTSEQTGTQQTTTTEKSTVQTTEQSTSTTEGTTTQKVDTTTEQTTTTAAVTDFTTTEKTTTQEMTTSGHTTEESTTVQTTTQTSTTETTTGSTNSSTTDSTSTTEVSVTEESTISSTTTGATEQTTTESQQEITTENNSSSSCPDTEDDQYLFVCPTSFRRHPKYCNLFYQCTEDDDNYEMKVAVFHCPNNTIYDESKVQCVEEHKADKKCDGEIASRRRVKRLGANYKEPIVVSKDTLNCQTVGNVPFEKNSDCSPAFLKCEKTRSGTLRGLVHRCPQNYIYWSISKRCEREELIRDCKRTVNNWVGRWEIPTSRYNVAW